MKTAELMPRVLKNLGVTSENFEIASLLEAALSQVSKSAKIVAFKKNQFYVEVESSAELQELHLRKREILKIIEQCSSQEQICSPTQIKFLLQGMSPR